MPGEHFLHKKGHQQIADGLFYGFSSSTRDTQWESSDVKTSISRAYEPYPTLASGD
jgi:hypothetical protein